MTYGLYGLLMYALILEQSQQRKLKLLLELEVIK